MIIFRKGREFVELVRLTKETGSLETCGGKTEEDLYIAQRVLERNDKAFTVVAVEEGRVVAAFMLLQYDGNDYDGHMVFDKDHRGETSVQISKDVLRFLFENTTVQRLVGHCPKSNPKVLEYSKRIGMRLVAEKEDVTLMEITKQMVNNQQQEELCLG